MHKQLVICAFLAHLSACQAEDPPNVGMDLGRDTTVITLDQQQECPPISSISVPTLDGGSLQTANQTPYPVRGSAPGASTLIIVSGTSQYVGDVRADGRFCVEVQLQKEMPNSLELIPRTAFGCPGKRGRATITHHALEYQDAGVSPTIENRALGRGIDSDGTLEQGTLVQLNDGLDTNEATLSMWDPLNQGRIWIRIDLGRSFILSRAKIIWGPRAASDETFASDYAIAITDKEGASDPENDGDWTFIFRERQANASVQEINFPPARARAAVIYLYEDGKTNFLGTETFSLAEIEIYGHDPNARPPTTPDSCY